MTRIDHALDGDVGYVASNMRQNDVDEFLAVSPATTREALAALLLDRYGGHPSAIVASKDGTPICVGAGIEARPNVVTLLFFATPRFSEVAIDVTRFITRNLFPRYRAAGVHRIEAVSIECYAEAHRWIEMLGLQREAVLRGFGKNGETFHQFAWVSENVRAVGTR